MQLIRKTRASVATVLGISMLAAGCGGDNQTGTKQDPVEAAKPKSDPVELVFYSTSGDLDEAGFMSTFGEPIRKKFPHVTPKYIVYGTDTRLDKLVTSGETLDILYFSSGQIKALSEYGLQYDISELIKLYKYNLDNMEPTTVELMRQIADGGIYGLPVFNNTVSLFYNKDLFDKFGVSYPQDGLFWDDLVSIARRMARTDGGEKYQGFTLSMNHNMLVNQLSIPYTDAQNKISYTSDSFQKLFTTWTQFYKLPGNEVDKSNVAYGKQWAAFSEGHKIAMFMGLAALGPTRLKDTFNWDVAEFPQWKEKPGVGPQPYPTYFNITKTSKHKEQAFEVIAYLTSEEFQRQLVRQGLFPVLKDRAAVMQDFGANLPFMKNKNNNAFLPKKFASPVKPSEFQAAVHPALNKAFEAVLLGSKDINTALRDAAEEAEKAIQTQLSGQSAAK